MEDPKFSFDVLNNYIQNNDLDKVQQTLNVIIKNPKTVSCDISSGISELLKSEQEIQILTAKAVAELSKNNDQRMFFTNKKSIKELHALLNEAVDNDNILFAIQLCRALGNICFENDASRNILIELNVLELFEKLLCEIVKEDTDKYQQFRTVSCGFLLNFLMDKDEILKETWDRGFLNKLEVVIKMEQDNLNIKNDCLKHLLFILGLYSDNIDDCCFTISLNRILVDLLKQSENMDISEMCLQLLHQQCDIDSLKLPLAQCGICEMLYTLLDKHITLASDTRIRSLVQQACELIVIVLTGDDSMHYLYSKKDFIESMITWLSNTDVDFLVTGILAIGNFARTEQHCIDMVNNGVMLKLIDLLKINKSQTDDIRLQHALLSALRNIAIPQQNKSKLIESGLVEIAVPMLKSDYPSVVYKLLGTLRMLVDNQEKVAVELLQNVELIKQLTSWAVKSEHPGVSGESPRLMAWLIKNCCKNRFEGVPDAARKAMLGFIKVEDSVACLLNMLSLTHEVMQNEGLLAVNILVVTFVDDTVKSDECASSKLILEDVLIKVDIANKLCNYLKDTRHERKEMIENTLVLITFLLKMERMKEQLSQTDITKYLKEIQSKEFIVDKIKIENVLSNFNFK